MKKIMVSLLLTACGYYASAQNTQPIFHALLYNEEHEVFMEIDFTENNVIVPQQEIFGEVPGYIGSRKDYRKWIVVKAEAIGERTAQLSVVNDYGSEDFTATLTVNADGSYTLRQVEGSPLKFVINKKWAKMPNILRFEKTDTIKP